MRTLSLNISWFLLLELWVVNDHSCSGDTLDCDEHIYDIIPYNASRILLRELTQVDFYFPQVETFLAAVLETVLLGVHQRQKGFDLREGFHQLIDVDFLI